MKLRDLHDQLLQALEAGGSNDEFARLVQDHVRTDHTRRSICAYIAEKRPTLPDLQRPTVVHAPDSELNPCRAPQLKAAPSFDDTLEAFPRKSLDRLCTALAHQVRTGFITARRACWPLAAV